MNLAEATNLLAQREDLKTKVNAELFQISDWRENGYSGLIHFTIFKVDGFHEDAQFSFDYSIAENDTFKSENVTNLLLNEKVEVLVKDKTGFADIECRVTLGVADEEVSAKSEGKGVESEKIVPNAPSSIYKARYYFEGALDEEELRDVIEANTDGDKLTGSDPTFHIRISYDNFEQAIKSRELELEQIDNEIGAVKAQIKEAQKGATATSSTSEPAKPAAAKSTAKKTAGKEKKEKSEKKKVKKTARVVEEDDSDLPPLQPAEPSKSWSEAIADSAATGVQLAVQHRAGIFFAAASVAIFFFGDLASV